MTCNHETEHLVGKSDGILCKKCGRKFVNFKEIEDDRKKANLGANTGKDGANDISIEKSKTKAVPPEISSHEGLKDVDKKAVSTSKKTTKTRKIKKGDA